MSKTNKIIKAIGIILLLASLAIGISAYTSVKVNQCARDPLEYSKQQVLDTTTANPEDISVNLMINQKYYFFDNGILKEVPTTEFINFNP